MSKKNFDAFVTAAGKKKRPSPEEIEELSQLLHNPAPAATPIYKEEKSAPVQKAATEKPEKQVFKLEQTPVLPKTEPKKTEKAAQKPAPKTAAPQSTIRNPKSEIAPPARRIVGKERVRVTIDLEKSLYTRLKMRVIVDEIDLSTFVREMLERELV